MVIPNGIRILVNYSLESGRVGHVIWGASVSAGFTPTTAIATAIFTALTTGAQFTALNAFFSTTNLITGVQLLDIRTPNQPLVSSTGGAVAGASASPSMPNEVSVVVTLRTGRTGPSGRGRSYIPGWATNALGAGNVVAAAAVTALGNWAATWSGILSAQGLTFSLALPARAAYTGVTGTQHPARSANMLAITSTQVRDNHWDTQRRRGLK